MVVGGHWRLGARRNLRQYSLMIKQRHNGKNAADRLEERTDSRKTVRLLLRTWVVRKFLTLHDDSDSDSDSDEDEEESRMLFDRHIAAWTGIKLHRLAMINTPFLSAPDIIPHGPIYIQDLSAEGSVRLTGFTNAQ